MLTDLTDAVLFSASSTSAFIVLLFSMLDIDIGSTRPGETEWWNIVLLTAPSLPIYASKLLGRALWLNR